MKQNTIKAVKLIGDNDLPKEISPSAPFTFRNNIIENNFDSIKNIYVADSLNKFHYLSRKGKKILSEQLSICIEKNGSNKSTPLSFVKRPKLKKRKI